MAAVNNCPDNWDELRGRFSRPEDVRDYMLDRFSLAAVAPLTVGMALGITLAEARRDR